MDALIAFAAEHWVEAGVALLAGGWLIKIRRAVKAVMAAITDLQETARLLKNATANGVVDAAEAKEIAREISEDIVAIHNASAAIMSLIPGKVKAKLPVTLKR